MFKFLFRPIISLYQNFIRLFFDFDIVVNTIKPSKPVINTFNNFQYMEKPTVKTLPQQNVSLNKTALIFKKVFIIDAIKEFLSLLKTRNPIVNFLCIVRRYNLNLLGLLEIKEENVIFNLAITQLENNQIYISNRLRTIEELLSIQPYIYRAKQSKLLEIPVIINPIKQEIFSEKQLDLMKTKLAIKAKCKKYSMSIENIYDKIPKGLYSEISLQKDNSIKCKFDKNSNCGELQFLVTGKRKYDTSLTKVLVKYSEL